MSDCEIKPFGSADQPALVAFLGARLGELGFVFAPKATDADLADVVGQYEAGGGLFLLARLQGELLGTVGLRRFDRDTLELRRFYVHPDWRGQGIGTSLLVRALDHARAGRWRRVCLDTTDRSPAARRLFRRHGFAQIARYNDNPRAEIFMQIELA
jgi:putative acetyltransferase